MRTGPETLARYHALFSEPVGKRINPMGLIIPGVMLVEVYPLTKHRWVARIIETTVGGSRVKAIGHAEIIDECPTPENCPGERIPAFFTASLGVAEGGR